MNKQSFANSRNKNLILGIVRTQKPQTIEQLVRIAQEETGLGEREISALIIRLENEDKLQFAVGEASSQGDSGFVVFSRNTAWYWVMVALAAVTVAAVFEVPENLSPIIYVRQVLSLFFVLFLPGYTLVRSLFPYRIPRKTSSESMDNIERIVLSLGLSLALVPIIGLILYYTPLGLGLVPITLSLLVLTMIFGSIAVRREYQASLTSDARAPAR